MAKTAQIYCKKCQKKTKHWDNKGTDKEKTLGMFVCSVCKTGYTPQPKSAPAPQVAKTPGSVQETDSINFVKQSFYGGWAKDFVVSLIEKGAIKTTADVIKTYKLFLKEVGLALNGNLPTAKPPTTAPAPTTNTPAKEAKPTEAAPKASKEEDAFDLGDLDNLGDLNINLEI